MGTPTCQQAKRERRKRPARFWSSSPFFDHTLRRDVPRLFGAFPNFLHSGEDFLQAAFGLRRDDEGGELAATGNADPFASARAFDQFRELLFGFK
jgi:hypothetical protein